MDLGFKPNAAISLLYNAFAHGKAQACTRSFGGKIWDKYFRLRFFGYAFSIILNFYNDRTIPNLFINFYFT